MRADRPVYHPEDGRLIDRAVVTLYRSPASYTGEDVLEISGHGVALAPQLLLDAACATGARLAGPGEFAQRAALFQLERGVSRRIDELREGLVRLQARLTYQITFRRRTTDCSRSDGFRAQADG